MGIYKTILKNKWFQIPIKIGDEPLLVRIDFLQFEPLWQVNNLGTVKAQMIEQVRLHLLIVHSDDKIWLINIPKNSVSSP